MVKVMRGEVYGHDQTGQRNGFTGHIGDLRVCEGLYGEEWQPSSVGGGFPPLSLLQEDIAAGNLYAVEEGETGRDAADRL